MKYNNKKTVIDGIKFDSKKEADRYCQLKLIERTKEISELTLQPTFLLQEAFRDSQGIHHRKITYIADFSYMKDGKLHVEDVKGMETDVFKIKEKLFLKKYPDVVFIKN